MDDPLGPIGQLDILFDADLSLAVNLESDLLGLVVVPTGIDHILFLLKDLGGHLPSQLVEVGITEGQVRHGF